MLMSINFTFTENKNTVASSAEKKGLGYLKHRQGRVLTTQRDLRKGTLDPGRRPKIHMELKQQKTKRRESAQSDDRTWSGAASFKQQIASSFLQPLLAARREHLKGTNVELKMQPMFHLSHDYFSTYQTWHR